MALSGWYPDPAGTPNRYRYWDGSRWSAQTTDNPYDPPPTPLPPAAGDHDRSRRGGTVLAVLAGVVVLVLFAATVVIVARSHAGRTDAGPPATTTSGWNDSSPGPTAPTGTDFPPATAKPKRANKNECTSPDYDPWNEDWGPQDVPGRVRGGDLSITPPPGWAIQNANYETGAGWADKMGGVSLQLPTYNSDFILLGGVRPMVKKETPKNAAERIMRCEIDRTVDQIPKNVVGERQLASQPITVDGHHGWSIRTILALTDFGSYDGVLYQAIVIDTGAHPSFLDAEFYYPDAQRLPVLDQAITDLAVQN